MELFAARIMSTTFFKFPRKSRLYLKRDLDGLFKAKRLIRAFPFITYVSSTPFESVPVRMAVSVPKRRLKRAVDRNRVKRLVREAFRLNAPRYWPKGTDHLETIHLLFVYQGEKLPGYDTVSDKIILTLQRLTEENESDRG